MLDFCQGLEVQSNKYLRRVKLGIGENKFLPAPLFASPLPRKSPCGRKDTKTKPEMAEVKLKMVGAKIFQEIQPATAEMKMTIKVGIESKSPLSSPVKVTTDLQSSDNLLSVEGEKTDSLLITEFSTPIKLFNETRNEPRSSAQMVRFKKTNNSIDLPPAEILDQSLDRYEKKSVSDLQSTQHRSLSRSQARKSCDGDSDCESEHDFADFGLFNKYEAHERRNPWELSQLFDKVNRHFLPNVRDPMTARTLMESDHPIPLCYKDLFHILSAVELALFKLTETNDAYCYLKIKDVVFKSTKMQ